MEREACLGLPFLVGAYFFLILVMSEVKEGTPMTLADIIAEVDENRPNQFDKDKKTGWINEIEHKVYEQVINRSKWQEEAFTPYRYALDAERTLAVPDAHKDVYETYLYAKMDYTNGEIERYNADAAMHSAAWTDYAAEFRRNNYPKPVVGR